MIVKPEEVYFSLQTGRLVIRQLVRGDGIFGIMDLKGGASIDLYRHEIDDLLFLAECAKKKLDEEEND